MLWVLLTFIIGNKNRLILGLVFNGETCKNVLLYIRFKFLYIYV